MVMIDMRNEQDLIDCCLVLSSNILHLDGTRKKREEIRTSSVSLVVLDQAGAGRCDVAIRCHNHRVVSYVLFWNWTSWAARGFFEEYIVSKYLCVHNPNRFFCIQQSKIVCDAVIPCRNQFHPNEPPSLRESPPHLAPRRHSTVWSSSGRPLRSGREADLCRGQGGRQWLPRPRKGWRRWKFQVLPCSMGSPNRERYRWWVTGGNALFQKCHVCLSWQLFSAMKLKLWAQRFSWGKALQKVRQPILNLFHTMLWNLTLPTRGYFIILVTRLPVEV